MAESRQHKNLVKCIVSYLETIPGCCLDLVEADLTDFNTRTTRIVGGYYPDVFYRDRDIIIIGEAKTDADLLTPHTDRQLSSYIEEVLLFPGEKHIILSVPFLSCNTLYNYVNRKMEKIPECGIFFHLINDMQRNEILCL